MIGVRAPVAQRIEQVPSKHKAAGSNPAGRANVMSQDIADVPVLDEQPVVEDGGGVGRGDEFPRVDRSPQDGKADGAGDGLGPGGVGGGRGGPVGQRSVRALVVVGRDEGVDEGLQLGEGGRLVGLGEQPFLQRLLEAFDLAAGGGVVRAGVLLHHVAAA